MLIVPSFVCREQNQNQTIFISDPGVPSEFRQVWHCYKQVLKSSLCRMDEYRSNKLVVMHCAETRSVRILIATSLHLLYGIRYDIPVDLCEHAHVNFALISLLDHFQKTLIYVTVN